MVDLFTGLPQKQGRGKAGATASRPFAGTPATEFHVIPWT